MNFWPDQNKYKLPLYRTPRSVQNILYSNEIYSCFTTANNNIMRKSDKFHVSENLQNIIIFRGEKVVHLAISLYYSDISDL
jgi:hypothetical protein